MSGPDTAITAALAAAGSGLLLEPRDAAPFQLRSGSSLPVAAPSSPEQLAAVMKLCSDNRWGVMAAGAGTWLRPRHPETGLIVSTCRLRGVVEHEPEDLVVGVRAGTPLTELDSALRQHGQFLPLDPPALPGATIGAAVALRSAGPLRAGYGTPRDLVLGLEVVTGDGRLLRFGGRVVKNVAGYDGVRLLTGSRGRLGIITALFIRVRSAPRVDRSTAFGVKSAAEAAALALACRGAAGSEALEILSPALAEAVGLDEQWQVLVRLQGSRDDVAERLSRLQQAAATTGHAGGGVAHVWERLSRAEAEAAPALEVSVMPGSVGGALAAVEQAAGTAWSVAAHAADGVVRAWPPAGTVIQESVLRNFLTDLVKHSGTARWSVPPRSPARAGPDGPAGVPESSAGVAGDLRSQPAAEDSAATLTRRIAAAFDPAGILAGADA